MDPDAAITEYIDDAPATWSDITVRFLLGMIIEKASGQRYRTFLQQRIFDPLGMTHSSTTDRRRVLPGRVATYEFEDTTLVNWRRDWDYELPSFFRHLVDAR